VHYGSHLMAEVANTWPLEPTARTTADAVTTRKSVTQGTGRYIIEHRLNCLYHRGT